MLKYYGLFHVGILIVKFKCVKFNLKFNKVASAMLVHTKLLEIIAKEKKHTFISTGMSTIKEIQNAVNIFKKHKCPLN